MKTIIRLLFFFCTFCSFAQTTSCDYLEEAIGHFQNKNYDSAIVLMTRAVEETPDTTMCYGRCFNNIPLAYASMGDFENAEIWFKKILNSDLDDLEQGTDIMEPYANYHHNACMKLTQLYWEQEEYRKALSQLQLALSDYKFQTFSGTGFEKRAISIVKWQASLYESINQPDSVLFVQLHKILDTDIAFRLESFRSISNVDFYSELMGNVEEILSVDGLFQEKKTLIKSIKKLKLYPYKEMREAVFVFRGLEYRLGISDSSLSKKAIIKELLTHPFFD